MKPWVLFLWSGALLVGLAGCAKAPAEEPLAQEGARAPDWRLQDLDGKRVQLADFHGKVVVLDFWATWCAPCREEMPGFQKLYARYENKGLVVIGINLDQDDLPGVRKFIQGAGVTYPILQGDSDIAEAYRVVYMPTTLLIDRDGRVRHRKEQKLENLEPYEGLIRKLL